MTVSWLSGFVQKWFTRFSDRLWQRNIEKRWEKFFSLIKKEVQERRLLIPLQIAIPRYGTRGETEKVQHVAPKRSEGIIAMIRT